MEYCTGFIFISASVSDLLCRPLLDGEQLMNKRDLYISRQRCGFIFSELMFSPCKISIEMHAYMK